jgi:hypothetical protein
VNSEQLCSDEFRLMTLLLQVDLTQKLHPQYLSCRQTQKAASSAHQLVQVGGQSRTGVSRM